MYHKIVFVQKKVLILYWKPGLNSREGARKDKKTVKNGFFGTMIDACESVLFFISVIFLLYEDVHTMGIHF